MTQLGLVPIRLFLAVELVMQIKKNICQRESVKQENGKLDLIGIILDILIQIRKIGGLYGQSRRVPFSQQLYSIQN